MQIRKQTTGHAILADLTDTRERLIAELQRAEDAAIAAAEAREQAVEARLRELEAEKIALQAVYNVTPVTV